MMISHSFLILIKYFFIPFFSFAVGFIGNNFYNNYKERKKLIALKKYILVWINDYQFQLKNISKSVQNFVIKLHDLNGRNFNFSSYQAYSEFVLAMDKRDMAEAIIFKSTGNEKENSIMLTKLFISMLFLRNLSLDIKSVYDSFIEDRNKQIVDYNERRKNLHLMKDRFTKHEENKIKEIQFLEKSDDLLKKWREKLVDTNNEFHGKEVTGYMSEFLMPLYKLAKENFFLVNYAKPIADQCAEIYIAFKELENRHEDTFNHFTVFNENILKIIVDLEKIENHLRKERVVSTIKF